MNALAASTEPRTSPLVIAVAGGWAALGILLAAVFPAADWKATLGVMMVAQAFCGALTWQRFRATRAAALPDFLTIYLFTQFTSKTLTALGITIAGSQEGTGQVAERMLQSTMVPLEYQFQAEAVFLLAMLVFTLTWLRLERGSILAIWFAPAPSVLWWTYGLALGAHLTLVLSGQGGKLGMTQELLRLFSIGAIAILLGGTTRYALGQRDCWIPILALLPLYVLALRTGMKGEVALVSLPILLPIFRRLNPKGLLLLFTFVLFVVLFLFPFSQVWRESNWFEQANVGILTVAAQVADQWSRNGFLATAAESTAHWLSRGSSAQMGGLVMKLADEDGSLGPIMLQGLATIFIPRFLWPDKPLYMPGAWFTWYLGNAPTPEEATSATAMMLPTELYWTFGLGGVVIGMVVLALVYWTCWRLLWQRSSRGVIPTVAMFAILARSSGLEGVFLIYAISAPIILVIYVFVFDYTIKILSPSRHSQTSGCGGIG